MKRHLSSIDADAATPGGAPAPRRSLKARTLETVDRVLDAAHEEVRAVGYEALTIRAVAARAEVSPATAYTYFGSKAHLMAELFARRFAEVPGTEVTGDAATRLAGAMGELAEFLASEPELADAATASLLDGDPDVARLRLTIGGAYFERFRRAIGEDGVPESLELARLAFNGAMLEAGMGLTTYQEMGERLQRLAPHIVRGQG